MKTSWLIVFLCTGRLLAQTPGSIEPAFNSTDVGYGRGDGFNGYINTTAVQTDGKVLVAGSFTGSTGIGGGTTYQAKGRIARLNADGTLDATFSIGTGFNTGEVNKILVQADGKIIALGSFTSYNGTTAIGIARLTSTGAIDATFTTGIGFVGGEARDALIQPDGKIIVVGTFATFNGYTANFIVRLNSTGTFDSSFGIGTGLTGSGANAIVRQTNGDLIVGGGFTAYNGTARNNIVRLASTGAIDPTYHPGGVGMDDGVQDIALQTDGKAVCAGSFVTAGGIYKRSVARLLTSGEVDLSFDTGTGPDSQALSVAITSTGQVLVTGVFTSVNGSSRPNFVRLTSAGAVDGTFVVNEGASDPVLGVVLQADGKAIIFGYFKRYNGWLRQGLARVNTNGSMDTGFCAGGGIALELGWLARVMAITVQPDGKAIIGGTFLGYNDRPRSGLVRVNTDGSLDAAFDPGNTDILPVNAIAVQPDGKILIGGSFSSFSGSASKGILRLTSSGAIDVTFLSGTGFSGPGGNGDISAISLQPDGKILVAGNMTSFNGATCARIARLNTNGTLDATFNAGVGPDTRVNAMALLPDGSVVGGGTFTQVSGNPRGGLARFLSNGSLDPVFPSGSGISGYHLGSSFPRIEVIKALPDGRLMVGGDFLQVHGVDRSCIARLLPSGAVDATFDPGTGTDQTIQAMALQADGKLVVAGRFNNYDLLGRHMIARVNTDGSCDTNYPVQIGIGFGIFAVATLSDGDMLAGGEFTELNDVGKNRLARVNGGDQSVSVSVKAMLDGPYNSGTLMMGDALRAGSLIPTIEPYTALGYAFVAGGGGGSVATGVLAVTGNNAIVDWVVVELRDASTPSTVVATRAALIQRDGDVVATDGTSPVVLYIPSSNYHLAVRHRNHLGVMTAVPLALSTTTTAIDFTNTSTPTYGAAAQKQVGTKALLWAGDATGNGQLRYTGSANDRDPILIAVGSTTPNATVSNVYDRKDTNLDGVIKYTGTANDRDIILTNVGSTTPNNTRTQQLP